MESLQIRLLKYSTSEIWKSSYGVQISEAEMHWVSGNHQACEITLGGIPTESSLLLELMENLKGKRVYKTLLSIFEKEEEVSRHKRMKALSSLYTHAVIECEQGRPEFEVLLSQILENLSALTFER